MPYPLAMTTFLGFPNSSLKMPQAWPKRPMERSVKIEKILGAVSCHQLVVLPTHRIVNAIYHSFQTDAADNSDTMCCNIACVNNNK
jgi:hypothetical protein